MNSSQPQNSFKQFRQNLPIYEYRRQIISNIIQNQVTIIAGETGCGKTTQIPQYILEQCLNNKLAIAVTQPRKVAAITIAQRVCLEKESNLGELVGYSVRFEDMYHKNITKLIYMTDGMLLRQCMIDRTLPNFSFIIIDEAHERTINSDILLGLLKQLIIERKDLKLIIMSATIELEKFSQFFNTTNVMSLSGRCFPVELFYTKEPQADYISSTLNTILQIHFEEDDDGGILVFLTGQEEIDDLSQLLKEKIKLFKPQDKNLNVHSLYAALPSKVQLEAFQPTKKGERKVILSTNIAETSVTIDGIKYVVDTGLVKIRKYNPNKLFEMLIVVPISKSSSFQRAGRSGRQENGKCFRLYTKEFYENKLAEYMPPEILRSNLSAFIIQMKAIQILDIQAFDFMDKPSDLAITGSLEQLVQLNALTNNNSGLTEHGMEMAQLPLDPIYSNFLLKSLQYNCESLVLSVISILQIENLFYFPPHMKQQNMYKILQRFQIENSDHLTKVNIFCKYTSAKNKKSFCKENFLNKKNLIKILQIRKQLQDYIGDILKKRQNSIQFNFQIEDFDVSKQQSFIKCISDCLQQKSAKLESNNSYRINKTNLTAYLHPESILFYNKEKPYQIIFNEIVSTTKPYLRNVTAVSFQ